MDNKQMREGVDGKQMVERSGKSRTNLSYPHTCVSSSCTTFHHLLFSPDTQPSPSGTAWSCCKSPLPSSCPSCSHPVRACAGCHRRTRPACLHPPFLPSTPSPPPCKQTPHPCTPCCARSPSPACSHTGTEVLLTPPPDCWRTGQRRLPPGQT